MKTHYDRAPEEKQVFPLCWWNANKKIKGANATGTTDPKKVTCIKCLNHIYRNYRSELRMYLGLRDLLLVVKEGFRRR